ncbi:hypothetical protein [Actinomycetospora sp. CA-053990]|uniref:hypothetical protein n=1 Tax=Actinomycetospora sp. CA-053990 TaxID=3239891 RepID=UPI003D8D79F2
MSLAETLRGPTRRAAGNVPDQALVTPSSWRERAIAVGVPMLVLAIHTVSYGPWIEDDAGITFAYARSLSNGAGPVLQPGADIVEGFSNPLWLAILVIGRIVGLFDHGTWFGVPDLVLFPKLVALACATAMFGVIFGLARRVTRRPVEVSVAAGTITALVPSFVIWTTSGLENSLYALLVVALGAVVARAAVEGRVRDTRVAVVAGVLAGLAALTRPDGLLFVAAYPLVLGLLHTGRLRQAAGPAARSVGAALIPVGAYLAWRLATFGDWLPNTARAKRQGLPGPSDLGRPGELILYAGWLAVVLAIVAIVMTLRRRSPARIAVGVLLVPIVLSLVSFAVLPPDWMEQYRFATPLWPLGALATVLAVTDAWPRLARRARLLAAVAAALAVLVTASAWLDAAATFRRNPTAPLCFVATSVGERVNAYSDILRVRDGTLLAVDGGGTALTSRLRFVDLSGLTDTRFAQLWQERDGLGARDHVFETVRPTFFKIDSGWAGAANAGLLSDPRLARDYVVLISPKAGSGTWVRREAVPDPTSLAAAQRYAADSFARIDVPYLRGDRTAWVCGPVLRPPSSA